MRNLARLISVQVLLLLGLGGPAAAQSAYTPYAFSTLAGTPNETGSADGPAGAARFNRPNAVAVDAGGNLYVADTSNYTVRMIAPGGTVTTLAGVAGSPGSGDGTGAGARFLSPTALAVDGSGNLYVADVYTIRKITSGGVVTTLAGLAGAEGSSDGMGSAARFDQPGGVAVDASGNVYVADTGNATIREITPDGMVTTIAGLAGVFGSADGAVATARFYIPCGIAVDGSGNLYVADEGNDNIRKITPGGMVATLAGMTDIPGSADGTGASAGFRIPTGVAVDAGGNVYVADSVNDTIREITPGGLVSTLAGVAGDAGRADGTGSAATFNIPRGVTVDASGNIYVADTFNNTIRKITSGGAVTTWAGMAGNPGHADGTGAAAGFNAPDGAAVDGSGDLYVADSGNDTIRKIAPGGVVTTLAGLPGAAGSADGLGSAAGFTGPSGIAVDGSGNLYVADTGDDTIRKITPAGLVTTLAGAPHSPGTADGPGALARFGRSDQDDRNHGPMAIAVDAQGNVYVADGGNDTIRKITPAGIVSTFAGMAGSQGSGDGAGSAARFYLPSGVAVDGSGNVYVADFGNFTIRRITPQGLVTTIAGLAGSPGSADGTGALARFSQLFGIAVDGSGNVFVADDDTIRKITANGVVTTLAGAAGMAGSADGNGAAASFNAPAGVAVDGSGHVYVADSGNNIIRQGSPLPLFTANPASRTVAAGRSVAFSAVATSTPAPTYQWTWNGAPIPGATDAILLVGNATSADAGVYVCQVTNGAGTVSSPAATLSVVSTLTPGYLINLSARADVGTGNNILIGGFGVGGTGTKQLLVRGTGPALSVYFSAELVAPQLVLLDNNGAVVATNLGWGNAPIAGSSTAMEMPVAAGATLMSTLGAFPYAIGSADTALVLTMPPGNNTVQLSGVAGTGGIALCEIYDADLPMPSARLVNLSARAAVGTGSNILIGGFTIGGSTAETVLIRAVGPGLNDMFPTVFSPSIVLNQPVLTLLQGSAVIGSNTAWGGDPALTNLFPTVGAFGLNPAHADSVLLVTLPPGNYTAQVSGLNGGTGLALVEVYEVP